MLQLRGHKPISKDVRMPWLESGDPCSVSFRLPVAGDTGRIVRTDATILIASMMEPRGPSLRTDRMRENSFFNRRCYRLRLALYLRHHAHYPASATDI